MRLTKFVHSLLLLAMPCAALAQAMPEVSPADLEKCPKPPWPVLAVQQGMHGRAVIELLIDVAGNVSDARIKQSSGHHLLDAAAREGLRGCHFTPTMNQGKPLEGWQWVGVVWEPSAPPPPVFSATDAPGMFARAMALNATGSTTRDAAEALALLRRAATLGDDRAQYQLARMLMQGKATVRSPVEAARWMRKSALQNNAQAQNGLGTMLEDGIGIARNPKEAFAWYLKSAHQGYMLGQYNTAQCYHFGVGVAKDLEQAARWYEKSAAQGDDPSRAALATLRQP